MELPLKFEISKYTRPKSQLLKWVGNKHRFALEITKFFPKEFNTFYEPFIGSGSIIATVAPDKGVGSDAFGPLIDIWNKLKDDPEGLIEWYGERRDRIETTDKKEVYSKILDSFNKKNNGADFLFLTRACYGGIVRFRKTDGYMSTPCGPHNPISTDSFRKRVNEWHNRVTNIDFKHADYKEIFAKAKKGDMIYCDPPYSHSQGILYGAQSFRLEELLDEIKKVKAKGVYVALSIDGSKKSGNYLCDLPIPENLFAEEIFIKLGGSMLKRFQIEGKNLKNEDVSDRLLLTYTVSTSS